VRRIHYETIDSTNVEARRLAADLREPLLVTAAEQSAGRGRQGREWQSPRGGAWLSLAWPARQPPAAYAAVSLAAAAGVLRALRELAARSPQRFEVKWPNDILLDERKVAGILCEQRLGGGVHADMIIIGVGVNVNFDHTLFPTDLRHPATTLAAALDKPFNVDVVVDKVAEHLEAALNAFEVEGLSASLLTELRESLAYVGAVRTWNGPNGANQGRVIGLDDAGRLLLDTPAGRIACDTGEFASSSPLSP
jgi:BirA family transcriptional regulator, biotin operon repressor / biotin---[acetyl-CoA-carboxylase] ligase